MINNKYVYPYHEINYSSVEPVRFMKIPIDIDNIDNTDIIEIKISVVSSIFTTESNFVIRTFYSSNNNSYEVSIYRKYGGDCRINLKACRINNILYLYSLVSSSLTGSKVFTKIENSTTNQFIFENVPGQIPTNGVLYELHEKEIALAENITLDSGYPDASMIKSDYIMFSCAIKITQTLDANSPIFTGLSSYRINGIAIKTDGSVISPVRRSNANLVNIKELPAGTYILLANGTINSSLKPTFN